MCKYAYALRVMQQLPAARGRHEMEKGGDSYRPLWVMGSRAKGEKLERAEAPAKRSL